MALLWLAQAWAKACGGMVTALTVDHGLRSESAAEAAHVAQWCKAWGIAHETLRWSPPIERSSLPEKAREGRYALLAEWCKAHHVLHLLTAHTRGDQCETVFFRLARGSHVEGLAAMPLVSDVMGVRLLRPLLHSHKEELALLMRAMGQAWIEDPSNQNTQFSRNHIRVQLAQEAAYPAFSERVTEVAEQFAEVRNALFYNNVSSLTEAISLYPEGYASIDAGVFAGLSAEAQLRVLGALIPTLKGDYHPPRSEALLRLLEGIGAMRKCSLAGLAFTPSKGMVHVVREPASLPCPLAVSHGWQGVWDGRFAVRFVGAGTDLSIRALGSAGLAQISESVRLASHRRVLPALRALPALWHLDELVAAPHIPYVRNGYENVLFEAVFCSAKPLAGSPFFSFNTMYPTSLQER